MKVYVVAALLVLKIPAFAQNVQIPVDSAEIPLNWFNLDPKENHVQGISTEKTYQLLLKSKPSRTVVVAVIDSGVDIEHEDLEGNIWVNEDEIPDNGVDDDKNGYIDDVNGWNFIGGKDGNVQQDTHEITRVYIGLKAKYRDSDGKGLKKKEKEEYAYWLKVKRDFDHRVEEAKDKHNFYNGLHESMVRFSRLMKAYLDTDKLSAELLKTVDSKDEVISLGKGMLLTIYQNLGKDTDLDEAIEELGEGVKYFGDQLNYTYNTEFDPRHIVGDDYNDLYETGYGNNDVEGPDARHGTHVAGIIAAKRNNGIGIDGIAGDVKIMSVRAVPDGDERDKDVANAIRYAADNGAHIINMSFGKSYSPGKKAVDEAVAYAESKGVLMIHAAGNSSKNVDKKDNFPSRYSLEGDSFNNWMEVGASSYGSNEGFVATFSNYGKKTVDLFAPGVSIYSTVPGNKYESLDGTSMAAPATSGVAALLMSYFPYLTAQQVKDIIKQTTRKFDNLEVLIPGEEEKKEKFAELSDTGGVLNVYEAVKMAEAMKSKSVE